MKKTNRLEVRIDLEIKDKLKKLAEESDLSISLYLRRLINYADIQKLKF
jgi:predicted DNA-binding protein